MNLQMRNHKLLTQVPGELEHAVKSRCNKECTLDYISNSLQEVRSKTSIGRDDTHSTGDNWENTNLETKEAHDPEESGKPGICHNCGLPNQF
ncbi:hypothetical protein O181_057411 [Austropuccinia psidii MF-1]|uniref:Uncharacterized protein n=1 Tax=Austropuccinia psidii MF-1 TaxID=1389203 RepID=A0A9Q3E8A3_9BASI|nr:hypothetical protein [Austropuccinia psidii MF-1]